MTKSLYVTSAMRGCGKTTLALGLVAALERYVGKVAYLKPISTSRALGVTPDAELIQQALGLDCDPEDIAPVFDTEVVDALASGTFDGILDRIMEAHARLSEQADVVVVGGTDYAGAMSTFEFDINADIAKNLGASTLLVIDAENAFETSAVGKVKDPNAIDRMLNNVRMVTENLTEKGCEFLGIVLNRANPDAVEAIQSMAADRLHKMGIRILGTIPRDPILGKPTLGEIARITGAHVHGGAERMNCVATKALVAAMSLENVLDRLDRGSLIIVPGDRDDLLVSLGAAWRTPSFPSPSGLVLTGGFRPRGRGFQLLQEITKGQLPILEVLTDTYETAVKVHESPSHLEPTHHRRIQKIKELVDAHVDLEPIRALVGSTATPRLTPKQFTHRIIETARADRRHIVLPEGAEERILRASEQILRRGVADLTLLGDVDRIQRRRDTLGLRLEGARFVDPTASEWREPFAQEYLRLRAHKGKTWDYAWDIMADPAYFGTMMVHLGHADGMVSGSITTTASTLRPSLEFVKTRPGTSIASSVFFMCLPDDVLVYGDCAVNPDPSAEHLADIALASAATAAAFGVEPRVAMLSYSTGSSGTGHDVDKVRRATDIVRARRPELLVEGPIQYDAAIDPSVAHTKLPDSLVAGRATVFIFPDLNAGNNTYKAVQRSAKAIAIGPVMQGMNKPVNDLSRGCTVPDIFNTVAITAVQAQQG